MATTLQLTMDCHDPGPLVAFWCQALGYVPQPPPAGFDTGKAWYASVGVPTTNCRPWATRSTG